MIDEKKIKIEPLQALFQIGFKYGKWEGTVVINDEFKYGTDVSLSDCNEACEKELSEEDENKFILEVFEKFLKEYSKKMRKDVK